MSNLKERRAGRSYQHGDFDSRPYFGPREESILENDFAIAPLVATLEQRDHLSAEEKQKLGKLGWRLRDFTRGSEIVADHSRPTESCLLVSGFAARTVILHSGARQITAVHIAGDFVDLHGMFLEVMDHSVAALTDCRVAFVDHASLRKLSVDSPRLWRLLSVTLAVDAAIQRAWMVGLGRRNPLSHLANLLCELYLRLRVVGIADHDSFEFRVAQSDIADMLGLSVVHTNRTLKDLRASGAISWNAGRVHILNWDTLAGFAEFDPTYLNLPPEARQFCTA